ncbi:hypothetical protein NYZ00_14875, partial [Acinetobacter baumannii]|nr:hypothetical protein [Acinetobacter baumannii]
MEAKKPLRVLFCMGINQNFFDAEPAEAKAVWAAFGEMWNGIHDLPGVHVFGNLDDDQSMVGASIVKLLYYSYKIRKKLEITHRLSRSTILYAYV